jgi:hypothetical protein
MAPNSFSKFNRLWTGIATRIVVIDHTGTIVSPQCHNPRQYQKKKDEQLPAFLRKRPCHRRPPSQLPLLEHAIPPHPPLPLKGGGLGRG